MKKGILAGILIGIGATAYVLAPNTIIGSALFSLGLISVFHLQSNLFTGKIGGLNKSN
jgi:formate/nitrite transporter FocA (FNT family)